MNPVFGSRSFEGLDGMKSTWDELARNSRNVFSTFEWHACWWRHYGRGELQATLSREPDGRPLAILPLYLARAGPVRTLRLVGHGVSDELGPICSVANRKRGAEALKIELGGRPTDWDLFIGEFLPADVDWSGTLGAQLSRREASPVSRAGDWPVYLDMKRRLAKRIRYESGRLARQGRVEVRTTRDASELERDLTTLFALHRTRWGNESTSFLRSEPFHRELALIALDRGWLQLAFLELDGRPIAATYGFRYAGVESLYNSGRDPSISDRSIGLILTSAVMQRAFESGVREYRFLRGGEPYKYRFATDDSGLETVALGRGIHGRAAVTTAAFLAKTAWGRKLVRRLASYA